MAVRIRLPPTRVSGLRPRGLAMVHAASASGCEASKALSGGPPDDDPGGRSDARRDHALDPAPAWRRPRGRSDHEEAWAQSAWSDRDDTRRAPTPTSGTETGKGRHTASDRFGLSVGMIGRRCQGVILNARCGDVPSSEEAACEHLTRCGPPAPPIRMSARKAKRSWKLTLRLGPDGPGLEPRTGL